MSTPENSPLKRRRLNPSSANITTNKPFPLLNLPNELLLEVADKLKLRDHNSLIQANQHLADLLNPLFWKKGLTRHHRFEGTLLHKILQKPAYGGPHRGWNIEMIYKLAKLGINLDQKTKNGRTALHYAVLGGLTSERRTLVSFLLSNGADVNAKDNLGFTALHFAANFDPDWKDKEIRGIFEWKKIPKTKNPNAEAMIRLLIDKGADVNAQDNDGSTPLHAAVRSRSLVLTKLLLDHGADINIREDKARHRDDDNRTGSTPLHCAVYEYSSGLVKLLLKRGADITIRNGVGLIAFEVAFGPTKQILAHADDRRRAKNKLKKEKSKLSSEYIYALICHLEVIYTNHTFIGIELKKDR